MARIQAYNVPLPTGRLLVFDPVALFGDEETKALDGLKTFSHPYVTRDGSFKVYTDGENHFVDIHPQTFRAKTRDNLTLLEQTVFVDTATIGFVDLENSGLTGNPAERDEGFCLLEYPPGEIKVWFEQKGDNYFRGVLGIGKQPVLILNGADGAQLADLEKLAAAVFRRKSGWKDAKAKVSDGLIELHQSGSKDPGIRRLADALQIDLPRRR